MGSRSRRQFLIASGALLAAPLARAQSRRRFRVSVLWGSTEGGVRTLRAAFLEGLRDRGYALERNVILDDRYSEGRQDRMEPLAEELIGLKPDVLVAGVEWAAVAMRRKTVTIPIVLMASVNPVAAGLVRSLARPGTNVTGNSFRFDELAAKHCELLVEINPKMERVGLFSVPTLPNDPAEKTIAHLEQSARKAASAKGLGVVVVAANDAVGARRAFERLQSERVQGLLVLPSPAAQVIRDEIILGARRLRLPNISSMSAAFAEAGGLVAYGPSLIEHYRYAAKFVDSILKGGRPAEIPVEEFSQFEFVVNLKTARELGLTIPQAVLLRADRIIE
jgi:putative ABC transport system substrate-binding protein